MAKTKIKINSKDTELFNKLKEREIFTKFAELFITPKLKDAKGFKKILYKELLNGDIVSAEIREGCYDNNQVFEKWGFFNIHFYNEFLESIEIVPDTLDKEGFIEFLKESAAVWNDNDPKYENHYKYSDEKLNLYNKNAMEIYEDSILYRSNFIECDLYSYDELKEIIIKCL
jgi:hypothetical protein